MDAVNQLVPSQYSKLFVSELKPIVPGFAFLGLSAVSQEEIVGNPTTMDKPWPMSTSSWFVFGILFHSHYITCDILYQGTISFMIVPRALL